MRRTVLSLFLLLGAADIALAQAHDPVPRTDAEGVPLPAGAIARLGSTRFWHRDLIHSIRFSPDGRRLFTGTFNHEALYAWDAATGRRRWQVALGDPQRNSATFGRALDPCDLGFHSNHIVIILPDERKHESIVWLDSATGKEAARVPLVPPVTVDEYRFSRDGARVAISHERRLAVYDTVSGRRIFTQEPAYEVNRREGLDFSPDGGTLAVGDYDGVVHFLRSDNGRAIRDVSIGKGLAMGVRFVADGKRAVVRAMTSTWQPIVVLDAVTGAVRHRLQAKGESWHVWSSALGPKGNELVTCCRVYPEGGGLEDVAVLWDLATGKELRRFLVTVPYYMAISPDGRVLAAGGVLSVELFDLTTGKPLPQSADPVGGYEQFRQRPDGRWVCLSPGSVDTFDGAGRRLSRFTPEDAPDGGAWSGYLSPDGTRVARCRGAIRGEVCGPVEIWDPAAGRLLVSFGRTTSREPVPRRRRESHSILSFSPDGKALFTSRGESDSLQAWDTTTGKPLRPPRGLSVRDWQASLSPDGRWLAKIRAADNPKLQFGRLLKDVELVDAVTGRTVVTWNDMRPPWFRAMTFSPDSRQLAVAPDHETDRSKGRQPAFPDLV